MTLGQFSNKILSFLLVPLYTSILSTEDYGVFDLIGTTCSLLSPILTIVAADAVMRFCLDKNYKKPHVLTIGMLFVAIGSVLLLASYPIFRMIDMLADDYWWLFLFFVANNVESVLMQYLKGVEKIKLYTSCSVVATATMLLLNVLFLVVFKWGLVGYMLAIALSRVLVIGIIFLTQRLWRSFSNPFKIPKELYRAILRYTVPMIPNSLSWWISNSSDKYMIRYFIDASAVGVYSVAYKIPTILTMFTTIFISALQISSVEDFGSEKSRKFFSNTYKAFSSLGIVVSAVLVASAALIAKVLFQNDFYEAWKPSCILIVAFVFNALAGFIGTVYTASKKTKFLFHSTLIAASLNIVLNFILMRFIGIYGAALATLASYACVWLARLIHSRKILPFKINLWSDLVSYLLLGVEVFLMIYMDQMFNLPVILIALVIISINIYSILKTGVLNTVLRRFKKEKV